MRECNWRDGVGLERVRVRQWDWRDGVGLEREGEGVQLERWSGTGERG